jgi:hypothetical protein
MSRFRWGIVGLIALTTVGALGYFWGGRDKVAIMSFASAEIDLGTVLNGESENVELTLTNHGSFPVLVDRLNNSCSCMTASFRATEVGPGASLKIPMQIRSSRIGLNHEVVEAITFPPAARPIRATIKYTCDRSIELREQIYPIGERGLIGTTWPLERFLLIEHCPQPASLSLSLPRDPRMTYELDTERFESGDKIVVLRFAPNRPHKFGFFFDTLTLQAQFSDNQVSIPFTVTGTLLDDRAEFPGIDE